jgi:hypothetical protein
MRSSLTSNVMRAALVAGLAAFGCSPAENSPPIPTGSGGSSTSGSGGSSTGSGGSSTGSGGSSTGSGGSETGSGGTTGSGGSSTGSGGTVVPDGGGNPEAGGDTGGPPANDIRRVVPTAGCGKAPPPTGNQSIPTMGTKSQNCADSNCNPWSYTRNYTLILPQGYNNMRAYPLIFQGGGCGSGAGNIYPLQNSVDQSVIRVGIAPPPNAIGHATNPGQGCFDDKEGDDSVDWVFYEALYDRLATQVCFDQNRVMASGNSSGAWFSNEVGCKYAGAAKYSIRAIMPNTGGLPTDARHVPTCTQNPMAGMWVHETGDPENPFTGNITAINRAMRVNNCTIGTSYQTAMFDPFPIGGGQGDNVCRKMRGCPELYPLVVCPLPGSGHGSHDNVTNPGFATFIKLFSAGNLIVQ